jgi:FkbM family methyltransferase
MKKILKKMILRMEGKKKFQPFFEKMHKVALAGMHIGYGGNVGGESSGEKNAIEYIAQKYKHVKDPIIVFDVGANIGNYTLLLNKILREKAKIYSFEPSKETYKKFGENTEKIQEVQHYNLGFGNEDTTMTLYNNVEGSGLASVYKRNLDHFQIEMSLEETIEIRTIDSFCLQNGIEYIHFLKLDVEGHELKVLEGAKEMIKSGKIDCIQFEFGGCNIDSRTYFQDFFYLLQDHYKIYRIVKDGLYCIDEYNESYECFMTTNFFAERIN